jgi:hypothetical protein
VKSKSDAVINKQVVSDSAPSAPSIAQPNAHIVHQFDSKLKVAGFRS